MTRIYGYNRILYNYDPNKFEIMNGVLLPKDKFIRELGYRTDLDGGKHG